MERLPAVFYTLSKLFWLIIQPASLALLLILAGLWFARVRPVLSRWLAGVGLATFALIFLTPLPKLLIYPLEQRFAGVPKPKPDDKIAGIIMLGGFEEDIISRERGGLEVNGDGERILEGLLLARRFPAARVVFTGGSLAAGEHGGSDAVRQYLLDSGIALDRIVIEPASRTTYENAQFLRPMLNIQPGDRFVLITSAFHMPRSAGVFRAQGSAIIPDQVDYRTTLHDGFWQPYYIPADGLRTADQALKEWFGLAAYYLAGRTSALWPAP